MAVDPHPGAGASTPTGVASTPPSGSPALTGDQSSAKATITATLSMFGLDSLGDWAWQKFLSGENVNQIMIDMRQTTEYKTRFPAMDALAKRGQAITEAQYVGYEQSIFSLAQSNGLPRGMYTSPDDIAKMLINGVSVSEATDRMSSAVYAAYTAPASVRAAMEKDWGVKSGDLIGLYLDSDKSLPLIKNQFAAAQVGGAAADQGLDVDLATQQALAAKGVTYGTALTGFGNAAALRGLTGGFGETVDQAALIGAQFGDQSAAQAQERVQKGRTAAFGPSGGEAAGSTGVTGLGASKGL